MKSWVRENLKNLARAGELGKRATARPVVLNTGRPDSEKAGKQDDAHIEHDHPAEP